ncbi:DNA-directed RNA polymerase subunit alpha [bacterium]|nr:DNA-directed RNA polymerase subunit alpha [bacterium]
MIDIFFPKNLEYVKNEKENEGTIIIEPCYPGYGLTWGNALRRVLLSSLEGAAISAVKIKGAKHEFTTLPYIKEDVLEIILNLKLLRLKIFSNEPVKLCLKVSGEREVKASDFEKSSSFEIVNPDLHIATLTDKKASLQLEAIAEKGYGYIPSEQKDRSKFDLGTIIVDSVFSPVQKVGLKIENVRVGKRTDFNKIILSIKTDGVISPWEAFVQAVNLLSEQFDVLKKMTQKKSEKLIPVKKASKKISRTTKKKNTKKTKKVKKTKKRK